jgi:hypothetical protein
MQQFSKIELQNNSGRVSDTHPFQLFGPIPSNGSYLNIQIPAFSERDFNQIVIEIHWDTVPVNFASYYEGYNLGLNNASFKVNFFFSYDEYLHLLNEHPLSLYGEDEKSKRVLQVSIFALPLRKEILSQAPVHNSGEFSLRMVLVAPEEAFGHRAFSAALSKAVLFNTKWWHSIWNKKRPMPSAPYIPVVKKMLVSKD